MITIQSTQQLVKICTPVQINFTPIDAMQLKFQFAHEGGYTVKQISDHALQMNIYVVTGVFSILWTHDKVLKYIGPENYFEKRPHTNF